MRLIAIALKLARSSSAALVRETTKENVLKRSILTQCAVSRNSTRRNSEEERYLSCLCNLYIQLYIL